MAYLEFRKRRGKSEVWGTSPSEVQGRSPGRSSGVQSPPKAVAYFVPFDARKIAKFASIKKNHKKYTVDVREGAGEGGIAACPR